MPDEAYRLSRGVHANEREAPAYPLPPANVFVSSPDKGIIDIRWDNPALHLGNGDFDILGVNIYRSFDSEWSSYELVNPVPIGATFYRDRTDNVVVTDEDVSGSFVARGSEHPSGLWVLRPTHYPIVKAGGQGVPANHPDDVILKIDGVVVPVQAVAGVTGEVYLRTAKTWNHITRTLADPTLPTNGSTVTLSYRYNRVVLSNSLNQRTFYKVTTLATLNGERIETPLVQTEARNPSEIEKIDYIWAEAIRRNRWILEQGGEAVKVFIRKWVGARCSCYNYDHKQAENDCAACFGTGISGGYEGPFDILIAPQDGERRVDLSENGMQVMHQYEVWTGPTPLLSQRDFIVRQNNDRYSIGPVNIPSNRGTVLQQHFQIGYLSERDIRYSVPANAEMLQRLAFPQTRIPKQNVEGTVFPQVTDNPNSADGRKDRGRTPTYGRITR